MAPRDFSQEEYLVCEETFFLNPPGIFSTRNFNSFFQLGIVSIEFEKNFFFAMDVAAHPPPPPPPPPTPPPPPPPTPTHYPFPIANRVPAIPLDSLGPPFSLSLPLHCVSRSSFLMVFSSNRGEFFFFFCRPDFFPAPCWVIATAFPLSPRLQFGKPLPSVCRVFGFLFDQSLSPGDLSFFESPSTKAFNVPRRI